MEYNIKYIPYSGYTMEYIKYMGFGTYPNQFKHIFMDSGHFWTFGSYIFQKPIRRPPQNHRPPFSPSTQKLSPGTIPMRTASKS